MGEIETLWHQHLVTAFPQECSGEHIDGIELVLLDADTAGCIQTYLATHGKSDVWRTAVLGLCYRDLSIVVRELKGEPQKYFTRLENLTRLVLQSQAQRPNKAD